MAEKTKTTVYKSHKLCERNGAASLVEERVMTAILALSDQRQEFDKNIFYKLPIKEYAIFRSIPLNEAYKEVREAVEKLQRTIFTFSWGEHEKRGLKITPITTILYNDTDKTVEVKWNEYFIPHISGFSKICQDNLYTKLNPAIANTRSEYTIRLYEVFKKWEKAKTKEFLLTELYFYLNLPSDYSYFDFKRYILAKAIDEISKIDKLRIDYEEIKSGRAIIALKIYFSEK